MSPNNEPILKGLPRELLDRVIEYVSDGAVLMLRLASKHLETATKDRFNDTYVANQFCVIQFEKSSERLADAFVSMPRLRENIQAVLLTFDPGNGEDDFRIIDVFPSKFTTMRNVLRRLSSHGVSLQADFCAHSFDMIVDGPESSIFDPERLARDFFRAVAVSGVKAELMVLAPSERQHLENLPDGFGRVLAPAFSTLKEVGLGCGQHGVSCGSPGEGSGGLPIAKQICASANQLQVLHISLVLFDAGPRHGRILEEMVLSNHSSALKRLVIEDAFLEMDSLRKVITHVKPTLSHLTLSRVMLTPFWREGKAVTFLEVYQMMTEVPGLQDLLLGNIIQGVGGAQDSDGKFRRWLKWTRENRPADGRDLAGFIGRDKVKLGLEKLIQKQMTHGHLLSMFA